MLGNGYLSKKRSPEMMFGDLGLIDTCMILQTDITSVILCLIKMVKSFKRLAS